MRSTLFLERQSKQEPVRYQTELASYTTSDSVFWNWVWVLDAECITNINFVRFSAPPRTCQALPPESASKASGIVQLELEYVVTCSIVKVLPETLWGW